MRENEHNSQSPSLANNSETSIRNKITLITFICSIFVVYIHACNIKQYGLSGDSAGLARFMYLFESYCEEVFDIAVPVFFIISGMLFFRTFEIKKLLTKWRSRLFSLVIPYVLWCSIYYFYYVVCTRTKLAGFMSGGEPVELSIRTWLRYIWPDPYYTLWFLENLIIFVILAPVIWLLLKDHKRKIPTGAVMLIVLLCVYSRYLLHISWLNGLDTYLVGSWIGLNCKELFGYRNKAVSLVGAAVLAVSFALDFEPLNILTEIVVFLAIWFAFDLLKLSDRKMPWWMGVTFFTYVAHDLLLEALEKIFLLLCGRSAVCALLDYVLMPIATLLLLFLAAYVMRRWLPHLWKALSGSRK